MKAGIVSSDDGGGWRLQAACAGDDPRRFTDPRPGTDDTRHAIATCQSCPVRQPCLDEALTHPAASDVGIWGATTPEQRTLLRRPPPAAAAVVASPAPAGLFATLDGDLTDLTGRALTTRLPAAPHQLLLIDGRPVLRTDDLTETWRHIVVTVDDYQPANLAPFVLSEHGELTDPTGRSVITRLPAPPHLLVVHDGQPVSRHHHLDQARQAALARTVTRHRAPASGIPETSSTPRTARRLAARR